MHMEFDVQNVMIYFYLILGVGLQLCSLFVYPLYRLAKNRQSFIGWWFLSINAAWSVFVYYDIWQVFYRPDEWSLDSPGFVLAGYAIFGPVLIWLFHAPIYILGTCGVWAFNKLSKRDAVNGAPS